MANRQLYQLPSGDWIDPTFVYSIYVRDRRADWFQKNDKEQDWWCEISYTNNMDNALYTSNGVRFKSQQEAAKFRDELAWVVNQALGGLNGSAKTVG